VICRLFSSHSIWKRYCNFAAALFLAWASVAHSASPEEQLRGRGAVLLSPDSGTTPTRQQRIDAYFRENPELWKTIGKPGEFSAEIAKILTQELDASGQSAKSVQVGRLASQIEPLLSLTASGGQGAEIPASTRTLVIDALASDALQTRLDHWLQEAKFSDSPAVEKFKGSSLFSGIQGIPPRAAGQTQRGYIQVL